MLWVALLYSINLSFIHFLFSFLPFKMGLPPAYFPEYNMVYRMMRNAREKYELYQAMPESTLKEIKTVGNRHLVTIQRNNQEHTFEVSHCAILIGSRPDLSFLSNINKGSHSEQNNNNINNNNQHEIVAENFVIRGLRRLKIFCEKCRHLNLCFGNRSRNCNNNLLNSLIEDTMTTKKDQQCECEEFLISESQKRQVDDSGIGHGEDAKKAIDCKNNPIAVNKFTNEFLNVPGIFALGPLVGDNFVRFIAGGALSISSYLMKN